MTKIFISGGPGSGKTTYAKKLAAQMNIPHFDLDDIKWINEKNNFNCERPREERLQLLDKILSENSDWVIEGIYTKDWITPILEQSDKIIILKPFTFVRQYRIIKRFIKRILHIEPKNHKENLITLLKLLRYSFEYDKYLPELLNKIQRLNKPVEFIR